MSKMMSKEGEKVAGAPFGGGGQLVRQARPGQASHRSRGHKCEKAPILWMLWTTRVGGFPGRAAEASPQVIGYVVASKWLLGLTPCI